MLDSRTKQTIDNACDTLVGRVPSPQTQVDIITTALIYKFMDDMDLDGLELSDKRTFFVGDLEPYAFSTIVNTKGNQERMNLYLTGLEKVQTAKSVPELFRRIFKEAMIPFRDPTTFALFLKEINELKYDDSETLGDAFEYLLNKMATAKNAGQFRTPRNIIDFIVDVVKPTKDDTILDPACGTAGFLISAYKHITSGGKLTPDELKRVTNSIVGLDIDPTMVKLSLVNLYLHKFEQPNIYEYDTLSNDTRWGDRYDIILANPPFMTPKGGITPHKRFAINANRSEVLFADYFMEHLTINGRAGFVVPEGIIFQTANAYKELRKMMLDGYLYAVVSLPAGVFNPYAGVKTSILFFDRAFAKQNKDILFVRVDNDGFSLGAQRTPIKQNDLPEALKIINEYRDGKDVSGYERAMVVSKERIAENNYDLTAAKYVEKADAKCKYEMVKLGDVIEIVRGITFSKKDQIFDTPSDPKDVLRVVTTKGAQEYGIDDNFLYLIPKHLLKNDKQLLKENDILISIANSLNLVGRLTLVPKGYGNVGFGAFLGNIRPNCEKVLPKFLYYILKTDVAKDYFQRNARTTTNISNLPASVISEYLIPLPPLDVQKQIVDEIENKQSAINHAREIIKNLERERQYFACLLDGINYDEVNFDKFVSTLTPVNKIQKTDFLQTGEYPIIDQSQDFIAGYTNNADLVNKLSAPVVVFGDHTCAIKYIDFDFAQGADGIKILTTDAKHLLPKYLYFYLIGNPIDSSEYKRHFSMLKDISILVPSIDDQKRIVAKLEAEQEIIDANKRLIDLMQDKINQVINRIYKCDI